jgi:tetratricopeptide (TPR) repeat protein
MKGLRWLFPLLLTPALWPHPEIDAALGRINPLIAARPDDAALYLERGQLYLRHEAWLEAEANLLRAHELNPRLAGLERARGELALATRQPAAARDHFQRELAVQPNDPETLILRARALAALGDTTAAIKDYDAALATLAAPTPELILARAALSQKPEDALAVLESGLARLGPALVLELKALNLEETLGRYDAALQRIDRLTTAAERREGWLKRRGDVLLRAQRPAEARAAYTQAAATLNQLPEWLRQSPDAIRLAAQLQERLNQISPIKP